MSLINDALRRAAQKPSAAPLAVETQTGLEAAEYSARKPPPWRLLVGIPVMLLLIGGAIWFMTHAGTGSASTSGAVAKASLVSPVNGGSPTTSTLVGQQVAAPVSVNRVQSAIIGGEPRPTEAGPGNPGTPQSLAAIRKPVQATSENFAFSTNNSPVQTNVQLASTELAPARPSIPDLKLQGVYFRRTNPSVLINGRTLFAGDTIENSKVVAIGKQSVTLEFRGQTIVLSLQ